MYLLINYNRIHFLISQIKIMHPLKNQAFLIYPINYNYQAKISKMKMIKVIQKLVKKIINHFKNKLKLHNYQKSKIYQFKINSVK